MIILDDGNLDGTGATRDAETAEDNMVKIRIS